MAFKFCPLHTPQGQQTAETPIKLTSVLRNRKMIFFYGIYCSDLSIQLRKQYPP